MTDTPIDRERVERLACGLIQQASQLKSDAAQSLINEAATLRALLAAKEAAEAEGEQAKMLYRETLQRAVDAEAKLAVAVDGLKKIGDEASVSVTKPKKMYLAWRAIAVKRIDIARATIAQIQQPKEGTDDDG